MDDICCLEVGKCQNMVSEPMHCALRTVETWCNKDELSVNLNETEIIVFTRRRKLSGFFEPHFFWGLSASLYAGLVSLGSPGFSADLEGACGC